jgi:F0F1-type ATP synthase assembly protein I
VADPVDDSTSQVVAGQWVTRLTTVAAEMVLPGVLGYWIDQRLGTKFVFMLLGFGSGLALGMWHLVRMTSKVKRDDNSPRSD